MQKPSDNVVKKTGYYYHFEEILNTIMVFFRNRQDFVLIGMCMRKSIIKRINVYSGTSRTRKMSSYRRLRKI